MQVSRTSVTIMRRLPHLTTNRYGVSYFRLIFTQSIRCLTNAPQEISLSLETKDLVQAQERYMLLYPCARAFRWSLHESLLKGETDVTALKAKVKHWKETNRLRTLLETNEEQRFELQRSLLKSHARTAALSKLASGLHSTNLMLQGALQSQKVMMSSALPHPEEHQEIIPLSQS